MIGLLALLAPARAGDVLVPEATPASMSDFSVAYLLYDFIQNAIADAGVEVENADTIGAWANGDADACFDNDACPANLWDRTNARLAVIIGVGQASNGLQVEVRLVGANDTAPVKVIREVVQSGREIAFAKKVAGVVADVLPLIPRRKPVVTDTFDLDDSEAAPPPPPKPKVKEPDPLAAIDLDDEEEEAPRPTKKKPVVEEEEEEEEEEKPVKKVTKKPAVEEEEEEEEEEKPVKKSTKKPVVEEEEEEEEEEEKPKPKKEVAKKEPARKEEPKKEKPKPEKKVSAAERFAKDAAAQEERRKMGIPWWTYAAYKDSGTQRDAWLKANRVRVGHVYAEADAGYTIGDVDRGYSQRVNLDPDQEFAVTDRSFWTGPGGGDGLTGRIGVGFVPIWFLDTSVMFGIQYGQKHMDAGFDCGETVCVDTDGDGVNDETKSVETFESVEAVRLVMEPRVRATPIAAGIVKPYAMVGLTVEVYDSFVIPDETKAAVGYSDQDGGADFGPTFGAGLIIDPISPVSIVLEVPYTIFLSQGQAAQDNDKVKEGTTSLTATGGALRFIGGVAVRF